MAITDKVKFARELFAMSLDLEYDIHIAERLEEIAREIRDKVQLK